MIARHRFIERIEPEPENGPHAIDEIVASNVDIHIERMDDGTYWMSISESGGPPEMRQIVRFIAPDTSWIVARTEKE